MKKLLAEHNKKFQRKNTQYEPRKHSVKATRAWEQETGKVYAKLSMAERVDANEEIDRRQKEEAENAP